MFLHLTHVYANSFTFFYLLENDRRSVESRFLSVIFTMLSFRKPLLIRVLNKLYS